MGFEAAILAIFKATAARHGIESRTAADHERLVRRLTAVFGIVMHSTIVLCELSPFVVGR